MRSQAIVLPHRAKLARLPIAELGSDEAGKPRPTRPETSSGVGVWVDVQPALQFVLDVDGGTGTWRVGDVLANSGKTLVQFSNLLFEFEAAGALSVTM
jgi:hypothetical protein